jgi:hypothetical protein
MEIEAVNRTKHRAPAARREVSPRLAQCGFGAAGISTAGSSGKVFAGVGQRKPVFQFLRQRTQWNPDFHGIFTVSRTRTQADIS